MEFIYNFTIISSKCQSITFFFFFTIKIEWSSSSDGSSDGSSSSGISRSTYNNSNRIVVVE